MRPGFGATALGAVGLAVVLISGACGGNSQPDAADLGPEAAEGLNVAQRYNCTGCHTGDGSGSVGPTWAGLAGSEVTLDDGSVVTADDDYLRRSIEDPSAQVPDGYRSIMPTQDLTPEEIAALVLYIRELGDSPS